MWTNVRLLDILISNPTVLQAYRSMDEAFQICRNNLILLDATTARYIFGYYIRMKRMNLPAASSGVSS
jgi:hypothetical protein